MRARILARAAVGLALACGSGPKDDGLGKGAPAQTNLSITTTGNGLVRGAGTDCRGSCRAQIAVGSPIHLVAVPDTGAFFVGWTGSCSGSGDCDLTMDVDRDVSATFGNVPPPPPPGKNRLTVVVQGSGRVTSSPQGIDCSSGTCSAAFDAGTSVTLTATPASGFDFSGWGNDCSGPSACTVTLSKDANVFASFVAQPPPPPAQVHLTSSVTGSGTVTGGGLSCGDSATTCDVMVAAGTAVTLTATAAGSTRFVGWGGACSGSSNTCQLTLQSDTNVTAQFQSEVIVLAPNDGTNTVWIALNSTQVFWPRTVNGDDELWSVSKNGGTPSRVASHVTVNATAADDSFLYWTDTQNIYSTPVGGGQVAVLSGTWPIGKLALDETGALYWTVGRDLSQDNFIGGAVHRTKNRVDTVIVSTEIPSNEGLGVDGTHVYFTVRNAEGYFIKRAPRTGGTVETVVSCANDCVLGALKVDPQFVYYRVWRGPCSSGARVEAVRKSDFSTHLVSNKAGGFCGLSASIDANASVVYWNAIGGQAPFGIFRANADGTGEQAVDTSNDQNWLGVLVDDAAVYYWHDGAIIRHLK